MVLKEAPNGILFAARILRSLPWPVFPRSYLSCRGSRDRYGPVFLVIGVLFQVLAPLRSKF